MLFLGFSLSFFSTIIEAIFTKVSILELFLILIHIRDLPQQPYLEPFRTSTMELLCENSLTAFSR